jgi:chorismate dehydratase
MNDDRHKLKIGAVRYLNTKPLVYGLAAREPMVDLVFDLPSRLADRLASGDLDIALIPSIETMQNRTYTVISDACIACDGPVWSVKLFSRVPADQIHTLALDEGSRTSVAMIRILLDERFGIQPELKPLPIGDSASSSNADAVLLIGDRAIHPPAEQFAEVWDLGDKWCRWAESPFVFAMWTARAGVDIENIGEILAQARDEGLRHLPQIAQTEAAGLGLTDDECLKYFRDNLHFQLGERQRQGLELFCRHASARGLAPPDVQLKFADCAISQLSHDD